MAHDDRGTHPMMAHIDDQRLMELALGSVTRSVDDDAHLRVCASCRDGLAAEADMSAMLAAIRVEAPPSFLAERIETAFVAETARSSQRAPLLALVATVALLVPLGALLLGRWTDLVANVWSFAVLTRVVGSLVFAHGATPVVAASQAVMLLGGVMLLTRLLRATALVPEARP